MQTILEKIYQSSLNFLSPLTPNETYATIVKEAINLVKADYGTILLSKNGELERVYVSNPIFFEIKPRKKGLTYGVYKSRKAAVYTVEQTSKIHPEVNKFKAKSDIMIPLSYKDESIGVLSVISTKDKNFSKQDLNSLKLFGTLATLAIKKTQLYDETKKAVEIRDMFISLASHELRTPLTTISGYTQLLQMKTKDKNTLESKWINELSKETIRLTKLVNELLQVNRIKSGELEYFWKECSLKEIIKRALQDIKFTHPDRKVVFKENLGVNDDIVVGDYDKLLQAVINLVDNALKFSPPLKEVVISLGVYSNDLVVEIVDYGEGIHNKDLKSIFDDFYIGANNQKGGIGLGLYLTRNIIDKHHGQILVSSKIHKGTRVKIKIPKIKR